MSESNSNNASLLSLFRQYWEAVGGEYIALPDAAALPDAIIKYLTDNDICAVVLAGSPLIRDLGASLAGRMEILVDFGREALNPEAAKERCSRADAGISGVDALIAATGTLAMASRGQGDRLASTLPPVHIVVATEAPIFADLASFLASTPPDLTYSFITGPSRTADIEKQLVRGVHGPLRVAVFGN